MPYTPTLDMLARQHFPHLALPAGREAVTRLLDALDHATLRQARIERHAGTTASLSLPGTC